MKAGSGRGGCDDRLQIGQRIRGRPASGISPPAPAVAAQLAISLCLRCMQFIRSYEPWPLCHAKVHNDGTSGLARMRVANSRRLYRVVRLTTALTTFDYYPPYNTPVLASANVNALTNCRNRGTLFLSLFVFLSHDLNAPRRCSALSLNRALL